MNSLYFYSNTLNIWLLIMTSIIFPLATNIKSLQRWGDNDISRRIKQSLILYDEITLETGTYNFQGANEFVLQGFETWEKNSKEGIMEKLSQVENKTEDGFIRVFDGKTQVEKRKYKVEKKDTYIADYRTVDVISELDSGRYGRPDFLGYLYVSRNGGYWERVRQNTAKDLSDTKFAETVAGIHGRMPAIIFLNNLNDSLALSHALKSPVAVDSIYASLLKLKTKCKIGMQYTVLERLSQIGIPDFGDLSLERILELRKDKALASFRKLIAELSIKLQSQADLNVEAIITQKLLKEIAELAPSRKRIAFNAFLGALSNLPFPLIGNTTTIAEIGKGLKKYKDFSSNWVSFILKATEK